MKKLKTWMAVAAIALVSMEGRLRAEDQPAGLLAGTWTLKAAEIVRPDGSRATDPAYGAKATGLLMIDKEGAYSLQIFRPDRPKFASGDKRTGTPQEYETTVMGMSTHFGRIFVDQ